MKYTTTLIELQPSELKTAPWNYKLEQPTPEMLEKFKQSILKDGSAGVLAVRWLDAEDMYEVIDGNHRLEVLIELGFTEIRCEDFGELSDAEAVILARRRNHEWFEGDFQALSKLMNDVVLPEIDAEDLLVYMPEDDDQLSDLIDGIELSGEDIEPEEEAGGHNNSNVFVLKIMFDHKGDLQNVKSILANYKDENHIEKDSDALLHALEQLG